VSRVGRPRRRHHVDVLVAVVIAAERDQRAVRREARNDSSPFGVESARPGRRLSRDPHVARIYERDLRGRHGGLPHQPSVDGRRAGTALHPSSATMTAFMILPIDQPPFAGSRRTPLLRSPVTNRDGPGGHALPRSEEPLHSCIASTDPTRCETARRRRVPGRLSPGRKARKRQRQGWRSRSAPTTAPIPRRSRRATRLDRRQAGAQAAIGPKAPPGPRQLPAQAQRQIDATALPMTHATRPRRPAWPPGALPREQQACDSERRVGNRQSQDDHGQPDQQRQGSDHRRPQALRCEPKTERAHLAGTARITSDPRVSHTPRAGGRGPAPTPNRPTSRARQGRPAPDHRPTPPAAHRTRAAHRPPSATTSPCTRAPARAQRRADRHHVADDLGRHTNIRK